MNNMADMRILRCLHEIISTAYDAAEALTRGDPYQTIQPRLNGIRAATDEAIEIHTRERTNP